MTLNEKMAYIRGLSEGLKLDENKDEVKVLNAILDLLDDLTVATTSIEDHYDELSEQVDEIDDDLAEVEDILYDEDDDCCSCDEDDDDDDEPFYEVTCAKCGETICVSEDVLLEGEIQCPNCGEMLEFDFSDLFDEDDCCSDDCGCDCGCCSSNSSDEDIMS